MDLVQNTGPHFTLYLQRFIILYILLMQTVFEQSRPIMAWSYFSWTACDWLFVLFDGG